MVHPRVFDTFGLIRLGSFWDRDLDWVPHGWLVKE